MKPLEDKGLVLPFSPGRLISLADMIKFVMSEYQAVYSVFDEWTTRLINASIESGHKGEISEGESKDLLIALEKLLPICTKLGLPHTKRLVGQLKHELSPKGVGRNFTGA